MVCIAQISNFLQIFAVGLSLPRLQLFIQSCRPWLCCARSCYLLQCSSFCRMALHRMRTLAICSIGRYVPWHWCNAMTGDQHGIAACKSLCHLKTNPSARFHMSTVTTYTNHSFSKLPQASLMLMLASLEVVNNNIANDGTYPQLHKRF